MDVNLCPNCIRTIRKPCVIGATPVVAIKAFSSEVVPVRVKKTRQNKNLASLA
jgi:hypothetical protein